MSSKTIGAACLVAGVTIGGGMLALPLTVQPLGCWAVPGQWYLFGWLCM